MPSEIEKSTSAPSDELDDARIDENDREESDGIALPAHVAGSGTLDRLVDTARDYARDYARAAASDNTLKAYARDWAHFARWCRLRGAEPLPPTPEMIGLYLADLASGSGLSTTQSASRPCLSARSNVACQALRGIMRSAGLPLIVRTATSRQCSPGSSASTRVHRCRKKRSC